MLQPGMLLWRGAVTHAASLAGLVWAWVRPAKPALAAAWPGAAMIAVTYRLMPATATFVAMGNFRVT